MPNREFHDGLYEITLWYKGSNMHRGFRKVKDIIIDSDYISFTDAYGSIRFYKKDNIDTFIISEWEGN